MRKSWILYFLLFAFILFLGGCGSGSSNNGGGGGSQSGSVFIAGEDAPVPSVVSFNITIDSITLNNGSTTIQALSQPTTVDFGRLMGLGKHFPPVSVQQFFSDDWTTHFCGRYSSEWNLYA